MKKINQDITTAKDIDILVDAFYKKLTNQPQMAPFFHTIDLAHHLPRIKQFWRFALLNEAGYTTNVFEKHAHLPLDKIHFDIWVQLFCETVDEYFHGDTASEAKLRARSLGFTFATKMEHIRKQSNE